MVRRCHKGHQERRSRKHKRPVRCPSLSGAFRYAPPPSQMGGGRAGTARDVLVSRTVGLHLRQVNSKSPELYADSTMIPNTGSSFPVSLDRSVPGSIPPPTRPSCTADSGKRFVRKEGLEHLDRRLLSAPH